MDFFILINDNFVTFVSITRHCDIHVQMKSSSFLWGTKEFEPQPFGRAHFVFTMGISTRHFILVSCVVTLAACDPVKFVDCGEFHILLLMYYSNNLLIEQDLIFFAFIGNL